MGDIAKVFMSGRSQAVRLPKKFRLDCTEVEVTRDGDALLLRPRKVAAWTNLRAALEDFDAARYGECFAQGREQPDEQERPGLGDVFG